MKFQKGDTVYFVSNGQKGEYLGRFWIFVWVAGVSTNVGWYKYRTGTVWTRMSSLYKVPESLVVESPISFVEKGLGKE